MSTLSAARPAVRGIRTALAVSGVLALVLGTLILVWPGRAAVVVCLLVAIAAIAGGFVSAGLGLFGTGLGGGSRAGHVLVGLVSVAAGAVVLVNVTATVVVLATVVGVAVGVAWIVQGVIALSTLTDASSRLWTALFVAVSIVAGIALLFAPAWGAAVLWGLVGASAVVLGALQLVRALRWGRA